MNDSLCHSQYLDKTVSTTIIRHMVIILCCVTTG